MKKAILILTVAVGLTIGLTATSCGGSTSIKSEKDSLAYALGVDYGTALWMNLDSTLNADLVAKGIVDVFAKKANLTREQAGEYIQHYLSEVLPKEKASKNEKLSAEFLAAAEKEAGAVKSASGLISVIETAGTDPKPAPGDSITVNYTLYDAAGKKLQSSVESGTPYTYPNVEGSSIKGFMEGVNQLGVGGKATLYLPYEIAYGETGNGMIEPKQSLKFEVEVLKIVKGVAPDTIKATKLVPAIKK
ncbi:MAG: FKBP-type peptidyl-prolyl cis-trans isomerase [Mucinivorans sp.]